MSSARNFPVHVRFVWAAASQLHAEVIAQVAAQYQLPAAEVTIAHHDSGQPYLLAAGRRLFLSLSTSHGAGVAAWAEAGGGSPHPACQPDYPRNPDHPSHPRQAGHPPHPLRLGVDIEACAPFLASGTDNAAFAELVLTPKERRTQHTARQLLAAWVRKEAALKAHGLGLATHAGGVELSRYELAALPGDSACVNLRHEVTGSECLVAWYVEYEVDS